MRQIKFFQFLFLFIVPIGMLFTLSSCGGGGGDGGGGVERPIIIDVNAGAGQVEIIWTSVLSATGYKVYMDTSPGVSKTNYSYSVNFGSTSTSYTRRRLTNGTTYYFVVTAVNSEGESDISNEVSDTPGSTCDDCFDDSDCTRGLTCALFSDGKKRCAPPEYTWCIIN